jgi:hypothetical protein
MDISIERLVRGYRRHFRKTIPHCNRYLRQIAGKRGLEIGGPSPMFNTGEPLPLYDSVGSLDNCNFTRSTVWSEHGDDFQFAPGKPPGKTYICDGSDLAPVADDSYDFILSAHNLEHFANPVKALYEWKRVLHPRGTLILVLPEYHHTFDHRRKPTAVDHIFEDFHRNVGEDDLTHLDEILSHHDLTRDPLAGSAEAFRARSLDNISNRCLHHHVFDRHNSRELLERAGFVVHSVDTAFPFHMSLLATVAPTAPVQAAI